MPDGLCIEPAAEPRPLSDKVMGLSERLVVTLAVISWSTLSRTLMVSLVM